jgi:hypothetical protein
MAAKIPAGAWQHQTGLGSFNFSCGWCGTVVGAAAGFYCHGTPVKIYICPHCGFPTTFAGDRQVPGTDFGRVVTHLPADIAALYNEARRCCSIGAYTSATLACRKLLMNIAVANGAEQGLKFIEYVEYLATAGYVPPNGKAWVDKIRTRGNEATHEIRLIPQKETEEIVNFTSSLLHFIYELPGQLAAT